MNQLDPIIARQFATDVVNRLRSAGYEALWAGGCVRDQLLGREPKDYDVATSAHPEQLRDVFGWRRTLAIGAAFGVITVRGPKQGGSIEVATFRSDAQYSDGRHPDHVTFSTAEEDAKRRDFTINGLFYDPIEQRVIDFVGGQQDLNGQVIRAIGDPFERIAEDKLRMLRAVRFAATYDFQLAPSTSDAIRQQAHELTVVSAERIAAELRRMLVHDNRMTAVQLLRDSNLLRIILPELELNTEDVRAETATLDELAWQRTLQVLANLEQPSFPVALAALLREIDVSDPSTPTNKRRVEKICRRWKLSNVETDTTCWLLEHEQQIRKAESLPWPHLQRILIAPQVQALLILAQAVAQVEDGTTNQIEYCHSKLALPVDQLNPPPLVDGNDLEAAGIPPGPAFKQLLRSVRDAQLEGQVTSKEEALEYAMRLFSG